MTKTLTDRILARIAKLGITPEAAARRSNLDRSTIRKLIDREGGARGDTIIKLARGLETSPEWLLNGVGPEETAARASEAAPYVPQQAQRQSQRRQLPVFGQAAGAVAGQLTMTNEAIEYVVAPAALENVRDAYALIVTGSSMEPRYSAGDVIYINPNRPPKPGDHVVIQEALHGGTVVSIKRFEKVTDGYIVTTQYNPLAEVKFRRDTVIAMHRVLTHNEVSGA